MTRLYYQGHGSFKIETNQKKIIYVDPYAGDGYEDEADYILVTHQHFDHNEVDKVLKKESCQLIDQNTLHQGNHYQTMQTADLSIEAVEAYNKNHSKEDCVGYILNIDGIKLYAAGDTSTTSMMSQMSSLGLDYALLPTDGVYNMDVFEALECAKLINARYSIPIHMKPKTLFDLKTASVFKDNLKTAWIVKPGEWIELK